MSEQNFYGDLGVSRDAPQEVVRAAYLALMRANHPDINSSAVAAETVRRVTEAYGTLGNPSLRSDYDATLDQPRRPEPAGRSGPAPAEPRRSGEVFVPSDVEGRWWGALGWSTLAAGLVGVAGFLVNIVVLNGTNHPVDPVSAVTFFSIVALTSAYAVFGRDFLIGICPVAALAMIAFLGTHDPVASAAWIIATVCLFTVIVLSRFWLIPRMNRVAGAQQWENLRRSHNANPGSRIRFVESTLRFIGHSKSHVRSLAGNTELVVKSGYLPNKTWVLLDRDDNVLCTAGQNAPEHWATLAR